MAQLPSYFKIDSVDFGSETNNYKSDSKSLHRSTRNNNAQRWNFTVDFFLEPEYVLEGFAFLNGLKTNIESCSLDLPLITKITSAVTNLNVLLSAPVGAGSIVLTSTANVKVGQFFKLSNHSKVYQIQSKTNSTEVKIYPNLLSAITAGSTVANFSACPIEAYIDSEIPKLRFNSKNSNVVLSLDFVEAL